MPHRAVALMAPDQYTSWLTLRGGETCSISIYGTFSAQVDCNQLAGSYTAGADGSMSIIPGPMTMAMCPEGSLDGLYLVALGNVTGWAVDGGTMNLTLTDGGTLEFAAAE